MNADQARQITAQAPHKTTPNLDPFITDINKAILTAASDGLSFTTYTTQNPHLLIPLASHYVDRGFLVSSNGLVLTIEWPKSHISITRNEP